LGTITTTGAVYSTESNTTAPASADDGPAVESANAATESQSATIAAGNMSEARAKAAAAAAPRSGKARSKEAAGQQKRRSPATPAASVGATIAPSTKSAIASNASAETSKAHATPTTADDDVEYVTRRDCYDGSGIAPATSAAKQSASATGAPGFHPQRVDASRNCERLRGARISKYCSGLNGSRGIHWILWPGGGCGCDCKYQQYRNHNGAQNS
jgi:hypothetical protein